LGPRSDYLFFWDADTLAELRFVRVTLPGGAPLWHLNELEVVNGSVLANVWYSHQVSGAREEVAENSKHLARVRVHRENDLWGLKLISKGPELKTASTLHMRTWAMTWARHADCEDRPAVRRGNRRVRL
jgi:hypothetical protein